METRRKAIIEALENRISEFKKRNLQIDNRIQLIKPIHEESVWIQKIDLKVFTTFLGVDEKAKEQRIREAYLGRVLRISDIECDNVMFEKKKKEISVGDYVYYNSDVPISPNVPDFYEIWVISINNVIGLDNSIDPLFQLQIKLDRELMASQDPIAELKSS